MAETFAEVALSEFLEELSSKNPTPGGGAVCAYVASLGAALNEMVSEYTIGKKKYSGVEAEVVELLEVSKNIRTELFRLADADAEAYGSLSAAYGMPKDSLERADSIESELKNAAEVPISVMRLCEEVMKISERLCEIGNKNLLSDAGCAAEMCLAAVKASFLNVLVNTKGMRDRALAMSLENEASGIVDRCVVYEQNVYQSLIKK